MSRTPIARIDDRLPEALRPAVEPSPRWVRVKFGGAVIADSRRTLLLRQYGGPGQMPTYYFPQEDVRMDALIPGADVDADGDLAHKTVRVGDQIAENAAWIVRRLPSDLAALQGYVSFAWNKMDAWYEEEEEIFVHARDPHKRVDVLASSRHVRVAIAGETVAETRRPHLLFETSLPTRYYIPREDVRADLSHPAGLCSSIGTAWATVRKYRCHAPSTP